MYYTLIYHLKLESKHYYCNAQVNIIHIYKLRAHSSCL